MIGAGHLRELDRDTRTSQAVGQLTALCDGHEPVNVAVRDVERGRSRVHVVHRAGATGKLGSLPHRYAEELGGFKRSSQHWFRGVNIAPCGVLRLGFSNRVLCGVAC
jgi:hypothetical protein